MKILFSASFRGREHCQPQIDLILETLEKFPSINVISPEMASFQKLLPENLRGTSKENPGEHHYQQTKFGILHAQACILEVSHESFQIGHEATLAIQDKKPVLCLSVNEDFGNRIINDYFFGYKYTPTTLKGIIQDFLAHTRSLSLAERFNLFLYPHQKDYLEQSAKKHDMNMSEYVRHLINLDKHQQSTS